MRILSTINAKTVINLERFPFIKQNTQIACIPASIEAVVKYHDPACKVDQDRIVESFESNVGNLHEINFGNISELLNKHLLNDSFRFKRVIEDNFDEWVKVIEANVNLNRPPLISTRLYQAVILSKLFKKKEPS